MSSYINNIRNTDYEIRTPIEEVIEYLDQEVKNSAPIRGKLIVLYGMSQMGKDYMIKDIQNKIKPLFYSNEEILKAKNINLHSNLTIQDEAIFHYLFFYQDQMPELIKTKYAEVYKTREKRLNDQNYLHSVNSEAEIPIDFNIRSSVFSEGTRKVAYSQNQIEKDLANGNIVFVTTISIDILEQLKGKFPEDCLIIKLLADKKTKEEIAKKEIKRYGKMDDFVLREIDKRYASYVDDYNIYYEYNNNIDYQIFNPFECHKFGLISKMKSEKIDDIVDDIVYKIKNNIYLTPKR